MRIAHQRVSGRSSGADGLEVARGGESALGRARDRRVRGGHGHGRVCVVFGLALGSLLSSCGSAWAAPQANAGVRLGVCGTDRDRVGWSSTCLYTGAHADVLFGRTGGRDFGVGPYLDVATADFADLRLGSGATVHIPVDATFPVLLSAGGLLRAAEGRWVEGLSIGLFLGGRSYNYHGTYVMAPGLAVLFDYDLREPRQRLIGVALHLDAELLSLPVVALASWLRGDPEP